MTLEELYNTKEAKEKQVENEPNGATKVNLQNLLTQLSKIEKLTEQKLVILSGYRCRKLNSLLGKKNDSQHLLGREVDFTTGQRESDKELFEKIKESKILFDRLVLEKEKIHFSFIWERPSENRKLVIKK